MSAETMGAQTLEALLEQLWTSNAWLISERIAVLRVAHEQIKRGQLQHGTRKEAAAAAHKLAGILGTFGLQDGTEIALLIERKMDSDDEIVLQTDRPLEAYIDQLSALIAAKSSGLTT